MRRSSATNVVETPPRPKQTFAGGELTPPRPAPPLSLENASGRRFTLSSRRGRYALVTFLYNPKGDTATAVRAYTKRMSTTRRSMRSTCCMTYDC